MNGSNPNSTCGSMLADHLSKKLKYLHRALDFYKWERQLIAFDLHDGLAQSLAGALSNLQAYRAALSKDSHKDMELLEKCAKLLADGITELRGVMRDLQPGIMKKSGIVAAVADLIKKYREEYGIDIQFHTAVHFERLVPTLKNLLYRILQESIGNACRHSNSKKIRVSVSQRGKCIRAEVRDWGAGFNPENVAGTCFGLLGIRERVKQFGGRVAIKSVPDKGTRISVDIPVAAAEHANNLSEDRRSGDRSASTPA